MSDVDQSICECGAQGEVTQTGTASHRRHFRCPSCGAQWREKDPLAVEFGRRGGIAAQAKRSPEERTRLAEEAANKRWEEEKRKRREAIAENEK